MQKPLAPNAIRTTAKLPELSQSITPTLPYANVNIFQNNDTNTNTNKPSNNNYIHNHGQRARYKPLPSTPSNTLQSNNNTNNNPSTQHIDTSLPKTNVIIRNKHDNNSRKPMNRLRNNTQPIVYKPLPPNPPNITRSKNNSINCKYNPKYDQLAINRMRAHTQPIIHKPLPPTPPNTNSNNNNKIKSKSYIPPQNINKCINNRQYNNRNTPSIASNISNSSSCSSISLLSISIPSISSSIYIPQLTPMPSTCISIPSSSLSFPSLSAANPPSPTDSNTVKQIEPNHLIISTDCYDAMKPKPLPPTPTNAKHGNDRNEEHLFKAHGNLLKCTEDGHNTNILNMKRNSYSFSSVASKSVSRASISSSIIMPSTVHNNFPLLTPTMSSNEYQGKLKRVTWCNTINIRRFNNSYSFSDIHELDDSKHTEDAALQKMDIKKTYGITTNISDCTQQSDDRTVNDEDDGIQTYVVMTKNVCFDTFSMQKEDNYCFNKYMVLSSKGLISGYYEWSIKITKCEGSVQEMGVVSNPNINNIKIINGGITKTAAFGARAVYGNRLESISDDLMYYASYNIDNTPRCYKNLTNKNKMQQNLWAKGDVIKICLDLKKYHISFFLNGKKVRKKISVQSKKTYYPIISFVGNFQYDVTCHVC